LLNYIKIILTSVLLVTEKPFAPLLQKGMTEAEVKTADNTGHDLSDCRELWWSMGYGLCCTTIALQVQAGQINPQAMTTS
jgi:hypothetical protein